MPPSGRLPGAAIPPCESLPPRGRLFKWCRSSAHTGQIPATRYSLFTGKGGLSMIVDHQQGEIVYQASQAFAAAGGVVHGFSTRYGGVSAGIYASLNLATTKDDDPANVRENYRRFCAAVGADVDKIAMSNQVHGDAVRCVTAADIKHDLYDPEGYEVDGLVTDIPGLSLVIFGADCLPILLYDPQRRVVAAVHAGWRGTALSIAARGVEKMTAYGCDPAHILAAIGPGISKCCFETHEDVPNEMTAALGPGAVHFMEVVEGGKFKVDLKGLNGMILERAGLDPNHIEISPDCTACLHDKYWSHRYTKGERGGQIALIALQ